MILFSSYTQLLHFIEIFIDPQHLRRDHSKLQVDKTLTRIHPAYIVVKSVG